MLAEEPIRKVRKVTVSLPYRLLDYADRKAEELGISRSRLVADLIAGMACRDRDELAAEGYGYYAQEASEFACCCLGPSSEVICRCS